MQSVFNFNNLSQFVLLASDFTNQLSFSINGHLAPTRSQLQQGMSSPAGRLQPTEHT
jgi:hypothetical protein